MAEPLNAKQYLNKLDQFLKELETYPLIKQKFTDQEQIAGLFRFWYMDWREQEVIKEARERQDQDPYGIGDMFDGDD